MNAILAADNWVLVIDVALARIRLTINVLTHWLESIHRFTSLKPQLGQ
jgi:hypothetical protein